jgi:hypothetical protein
MYRESAMEKEFYYVYADGLLGVKTNVEHFRWIYGSVAPPVSEAEFKACIVTLQVYVVPESRLDACDRTDKRFQAFSWNESTKTVSYRRSFFKTLRVGYNVSLSHDGAVCWIGKRYFHFVKQRMNHLHGIYYLLSDIANVMLLRHGYVTLYASAVRRPSSDEGYVFFSPPNTGKTLTATKLCEHYGCDLVGEDIVITDGRRLYACPWTNSYRKKASRDGAGSFGRVSKPKIGNICHTCELTGAVVLSVGENRVACDKERLLSQIEMLNGYLFEYYSSPIIKILGYFDHSYCVKWNELAKDVFSTASDDRECVEICSERSMDFYKLVHDVVWSEKA